MSILLLIVLCCSSALKLQEDPQFELSDAVYDEGCGNRYVAKCWKKGGRSMDGGAVAIDPEVAAAAAKAAKDAEDAAQAVKDAQEAQAAIDAAAPAHITSMEWDTTWYTVGKDGAEIATIGYSDGSSGIDTNTWVTGTPSVLMVKPSVKVTWNKPVTLSPPGDGGPSLKVTTTDKNTYTSVPESTHTLFVQSSQPEVTGKTMVFTATTAVGVAGNNRLQVLEGAITVAADKTIKNSDNTNADVANDFNTNSLNMNTSPLGCIYGRSPSSPSLCNAIKVVQPR